VLIDPVPLGRSARGWADAVARHAVVGPVLATLAAGQDPEALTDRLLMGSPLSAVLLWPPSGEAERAARAAAGLAARPNGPGLLTSALSSWHSDVRVLRWRAYLLARMATGYPEIVLGVYAAARIRHGAEWDQRIQAAAAGLAAAASGPEAAQAMATLQYWQPMLVRQVAERLRTARRVNGYQEALGYLQLHQLQAVSEI
jgi:hypothetical protein